MFAVKGSRRVWQAVCSRKFTTTTNATTTTTSTTASKPAAAAAKRILNVLRVRRSSMSILEMLEFEELILRNTTDNYLIINCGEEAEVQDNKDRDAHTSIVLGFSGKAHLLIDIPKVLQDDIPVLRRYTGGGTVIVDSSTCFVALIMNTYDADCQPYPREIMTWTDEKVYGPAFNNLLEPHNTANAHSPLHFKLRENDYIFTSTPTPKSSRSEIEDIYGDGDGDGDGDGADKSTLLLEKKIGGNAQTITKNRWVHHTSFLWDFNPHNMAYLQLPAKRPAYRRDRPHTDFITQLRHKIPSIQAFEDELILHTSTQFDEIRDAGDTSGVTSFNDYKTISAWLIENNPKFRARSFRVQVSDLVYKDEKLLAAPP